ncbi:MAG TPA: type II toxin-antitoxin system RelE/ParE family toxin, partial [Methanolinea sp.]|nr:type II toxin-antitoxin system RelE/ParE family toxin [Methanolinea sp.]
YRIVIRRPAEDRLKDYDKEIQRRFVQKIRKLSENPDIYGKPLRGSLHGLWELYFERKFRILYTIDFEKSEVIIEAIKHKDEF